MARFLKPQITPFLLYLITTFLIVGPTFLLTSCTRARFSWPNNNESADNVEALTKELSPWQALPVNQNTPTARSRHTAVWTGSEMIIWGGNANLRSTNSGAGYHPATNSWKTMTEDNAPLYRHNHTAVWTGNEMIIWGGFAKGGLTNSGARYDPTNDTWISIEDDTLRKAPYARQFHTAVWTNSEMIIWGGSDYFSSLNTGARYHPGSNSWATINLEDAPSARNMHTAVWTGSEMIIWGGTSKSSHWKKVTGRVASNTGARYYPATNSWETMTEENAPSARNMHTAVWTGNEMIIWGGDSSSNGEINSGALYDPDSDSWQTMDLENAPSARYLHTAVWTSSEMIIWGGFAKGGLTNSGVLYEPDSNSWQTMDLENAPSARYLHTAVWTNSEMIIWGGAEFQWRAN